MLRRMKKFVSICVRCLLIVYWFQDIIFLFPIVCPFSVLGSYFLNNFCNVNILNRYETEKRYFSCCFFLVTNLCIPWPLWEGVFMYVESGFYNPNLHSDLFDRDSKIRKSFLTSLRIIRHVCRLLLLVEVWSRTQIGALLSRNVLSQISGEIRVLNCVAFCSFLTCPGFSRILSQVRLWNIRGIGNQYPFICNHL